ncbi:hypothetical protein CRG98_009042 [Punica granatum]|uniref:Uncharacterized protein n=1 Tax=Punica granatum TaxID=22663 RepID=A0A2I0KPX6_PUNGR|nr:hypothetical protein CRG98_009042 [Punica granatum]
MKAGEKRKEVERREQKGHLRRGYAVNRELVALERELSMLCKNVFIITFVGICTASYSKREGAKTLLAQFLLSLSIAILGTGVLGTFSSSTYIKAQIVKVLYSVRESEQAEVIFKELLRNNPYRVEDMDTYSHVLYAKEDIFALNNLAHRMVLIDNCRPKTCCIIMNYYSLKRQHEKAVMYFQRALKPNKNYSSAWILMGHEYVKLKNILAATNAYGRAVDIDPSDYRAWYGLGQAYEIMGMPLAALHYFGKSAFLQPNDSQEDGKEIAKSLLGRMGMMHSESGPSMDVELFPP